MPGRSTATLGTTTTTTTNAVRKTPRTSAYFTRSTTRKKKEKKKQDLHTDDSPKKDGDGKSCSDEQAHILTVSGLPLDDAVVQSTGDDYDGVERVESSASAKLGNKTLTDRFTRADECFQQIAVDVEDPVAPQNTLDNTHHTHESAAANEPKQDITLSKEITDTKPNRFKSASPRKNPLPPPPKLSPYFPKPLPLIDASCLPFPPISASSFGLIQEQLSHSPFRLLIATIFLNRTRGPVAIPVLFQLFQKYPTIQTMADANHADIVTVIRSLGFQNQRASKFIALAQTWLSNPPQRGKRYRKLHYPCKRDGLDIGADEVVVGEGDGDARVAWEIAHLPGVGAYAIDSWRIFCRDILVLDDETATTTHYYEPEWKRVLPQDKELRAYLTWMWLKEGWLWDPETGNKTPADTGMMERAERGGVAYEAPNGNWVLESVAASSGECEREKHVVPVRRAGFSLAYS